MASHNLYLVRNRLLVRAAVQLRGHLAVGRTALLLLLEEAATRSMVEDSARREVADRVIGLEELVLEEGVMDLHLRVQVSLLPALELFKAALASPVAAEVAGTMHLETEAGDLEVEVEQEVADIFETSCTYPAFFTKLVHNHVVVYNTASTFRLSPAPNSGNTTLYAVLSSRCALQLLHLWWLW